MKWKNASAKAAVKFILLFGLVSAFGDITYEGARSVYGVYLGSLGASAAIVGLVTGIGEFLACVIRLPAGLFIDKTGRPWISAILGYAMLIAVPLLAIAGNWQMAAVLIILERTGKAIRSPGKDTMLSHATKSIGTGFGFGIHETLDQIGGVIGPLIFTFALSFAGGYKHGFEFMWIPAILTVDVVLYARHRVPDPAQFEQAINKSDVHSEDVDVPKQRLPKQFWLYSLFVFFSVLGFVNYPILSFYFLNHKVLNTDFIPALYAVAMAVDAISAMAIGKLYDKKGISSLIWLPVLTVPMTFLGFSSMPALAVVSVFLWGLITCIQDTTMRSAIADMIPVANRGMSYGLFNTITGIAMLLGSAIAGLLVEYSIIFLFSFVVSIEIIAVIAYLLFKRSIVKGELSRS